MYTIGEMLATGIGTDGTVHMCTKTPSPPRPASPPIVWNGDSGCSAATAPAHQPSTTDAEPSSPQQPLVCKVLNRSSRMVGGTGPGHGRVREVDVLLALPHHPGVIRPLAVSSCARTGRSLLVFPKYDCDLMAFMEAQCARTGGRGVGEAVAARICRSLLHALHHLHDHGGIAHLDVKAENVLVNFHTTVTPEGCEDVVVTDVVLTDFGRYAAAWRVFPWLG